MYRLLQMTNQEAQLVNTAGILCGLQNSIYNNKHSLNHLLLTKGFSLRGKAYRLLASSPLRPPFSFQHIFLSLVLSHKLLVPRLWVLDICVSVNVPEVTNDAVTGQPVSNYSIQYFSFSGFVPKPSLRITPQQSLGLNSQAIMHSAYSSHLMFHKRDYRNGSVSGPWVSCTSLMTNLSVYCRITRNRNSAFILQVLQTTAPQKYFYCFALHHQQEQKGMFPVFTKLAIPVHLRATGVNVTSGCLRLWVQGWLLMTWHGAISPSQI